MGQHSCGTLSTPCRVHALTNVGCSEGKWVPLNVRKVFLMFCTLSVVRLVEIGLSAPQGHAIKFTMHACVSVEVVTFRLISQ
jgi:hypothetical protein